MLTKSYFFENINKIHKPLERLTEKKERKHNYMLSIKKPQFKHNNIGRLKCQE